MNKLELLSPAGSFEGFLAALAAGADAVYAGGNAFGARAFAKNFTSDEILRAIDISHILNKRFYLTVNTLCKEREFKALKDFILPFYEHGLDGVIVQDIGVIDFFLKNFPEMEVHGSTQMSISNIEGAKYLKSIGLTRVVLARELGLKEISLIHESCDIEIESFIHGAMCYGYSGQCLLSSFLGGRSGNRGRCAQPCRLSYDAYENDRKLNSKDEQYCLSMKDLCTLEILPEIIESGVVSFKIEGRMKGPQYTGFVTSVYRKYIDLYLEKGRAGYKVLSEDLKALTDTYKRAESVTGYYKQQNGRNLITLFKPSYESSKDVYYKMHPDKIKLSISGSFVAGESAKIWTSNPEEQDNYVYIEGAVVDVASNRPLSQADIIKNLSKTGDSLFEFIDFDIEVSENAFLPLSSINELRRQYLSEYERMLAERYRRVASDCFSETKQLQVTNINNNTRYSAQCESIEQLNELINSNLFNRIYIDSGLFISRRQDVLSIISKAKGQMEIYLALPYIFRDYNRKKLVELIDSIVDRIDGFLIRNYDEIELVKPYSLKLISDAGLYCFNNHAVEHFYTNGFNEFTFPYELNVHECKELEAINNGELIVYGYVPLMISAGCVKKTLDKCDKKGGIVTLRDRYDKCFDVIRDCEFCYNRLLNSLPLDLSKDMEQIAGSGFTSYRICFTKESAEETRSIIEAYSMGTILNIEHTRGHFKKSVE